MPTLPALMAAHLPGRVFTSALDAAEAYARTTGPVAFAWTHGPQPAAQRATVRAGIEYALIRAEESLHAARTAHRWFVAKRQFAIAAHHRRSAAGWIEWVRFHRALLAELPDARATELAPLFPEACIREAA